MFLLSAPFVLLACLSLGKRAEEQAFQLEIHTEWNKNPKQTLLMYQSTWRRLSTDLGQTI